MGCGLKYDANNIYLATTYAETRNTTRTGSDGELVSLTKLRTSKLLLSTSSTSVCVHPSLTFRPKVKMKALAMQTWLNTSKLVRLTTSTKTSTCVDYHINLLDKDMTTQSWAV
jgi:predicted porin